MNQAHYFLGWPVPETIKEPLMIARNDIQSLANYKYFTNRDDLHMTAVFLGAVEERLIANIDGILSSNTPKSPSFSIRLTHLGYFGQRNRPRVIIYEGEAEERFCSHRNDVFLKLSNLGLSLDQKPFHPHVTLAKKYVSAPETFGEKLEKLQHKKNIQMPIDTLILYKVRPGMEPRYEKVNEYAYKM